MACIHPAFELLSDHELPEYRGRGLWFRHRATGCEVFHLRCEDEENTFAFGFRTPSRDSTGAAHIVEHSVLCGSEDYPVKDAFLVMARRSLATYLNALTYPDRTIYPASSAVEADYFNLMSVYGDAVFFPRLEEETFRQEGHRLAYDQSGKLALSGVVYNEMRGDYSSADSLLGTAAVSSLFEAGHPYSFDSGGDPACIPSLSYGRFLDFWAEHYSPANCRVFLYGNIDTGRQLDFLDGNFLSRANPRRKRPQTAVEDAPLVPARGEARRLSIACPPEAGTEGTTSILVNWLLPPCESPQDLLAIELLAELLVGHDGSPLAVALRESGLGEDLSPHTGLDTNYRQPIFSVGLRGSAAGLEEKVENVIIESISDFASTPPAAGRLDEALHSINFANREIRRGSGTYGTRLMTRAYRTWIRGNSPEEGLAFDLPIAELEARIARDPGYLPGLARSCFLENRHRTTVTALPDAAALAKAEKALAAGLATREAALAPEEAVAIRRADEELAARQAAPDRPEDLARLPRLRSREIPKEIDLVPREKDSILFCDASIHPLFTNGIVYLDLAFPLARLPQGALPWLPLLSRFMSGAGLPGIPYSEMASRLARYSGGFGAMLEAGTALAPEEGQSSRQPVAYMIFRLKALAGRFPKALELALSLLAGADFGDRKRLGDVLAEYGNDVVAALVPAGSSFALARAASAWSEALAIEDSWRGMGQFSFVNGLRKAEAIDPTAERLSSLAAALFAREGLRLNLTAGPEDLGAARAALEAGLAALPAKPRPLGDAGAGREPAARREAYSIPTQVGFAAAACPSSRMDAPGYAHETVLAHYLSTGPLWDELRARRGAYGASCHLDGLEGVALLSTYRDPRPAESLAFFGEALRAAGASILGEAEVEEAVVGAAGHDLRPLLPEERGLVDFRRELYRIDDETRKRKREYLVSTTGKDIRKAAQRLAGAFEDSTSVLISWPEDVQLLGHGQSGTRIIDLAL
jgi:Zn-dependent M16 (insulinase) family peptidase